MFRKGITACIGLVTLVSVLTACASGDGKGEGASTAPSPAASASAPAASGADLTPVTYSINSDSPKYSWNGLIPQAVTAKTGVSLNFLPIVGDSKEKMDIWLASQDYPDIVVALPETLQKYQQAGAIIPLEGLIDQYGPNIKAKFGKYFDLLKDQDGHIYSLYNVNLASTVSADSAASFLVQYAVLKEAGYPEVKTLDDLYNVLKSYAEKHPTIDGKPTIPFSGIGKDGPDLAFNNPSISLAGQPDHGRYIIDSDNNVHLNLASDNNKRWYAFLNKLYRENLLDKEIFSQGFDAAKSKLAQGNVLAAYIPGWIASEPEKALVAAGKTDSQYAKLPILFDGNTVDHSNALIPTGSNGNWAITTKAKNPERIIQMIDFLFSDEGQILTAWGIEGKDYTVVDGKRTVTQELKDNRAKDPDYDYKEGFLSVMTGTTSWFSIGAGSVLADGDFATSLTTESVVEGYNESTKEILSHYNKKTWADFLPKPEFIPAYLWSLTPPDEVNIVSKRVDDDYLKYAPQIILTKSDEAFEAKWNEYKAAVEKDGQKKLEDAFTKLWKETVAKYDAAVK